VKIEDEAFTGGQEELDSKIEDAGDEALLEHDHICDVRVQVEGKVKFA